LTTHGGRLPAETARFFGRSQEAAAIKDALASSRLVTLTGPGGVGKTRLAVKVAGELAQAFPDGVFLADLSAARDAAGIAGALASALGVSRDECHLDLLPADWLAGELRGKQLLLILDTCEHVIGACAALADAILRGDGGPELLVTSRQPLDLPGEVVFRIPPLSVGDDDGGDAVRLFADRAAAAAPGFEVTAGTLPKLVRLCRLLDGIPLEIELAALRLRAVGVDELLARLPGHLRLLGCGRRGAAGDRQQSLQASISWSYDLCSPRERLLWSRLSVFADGFDLAAAEAVCSDGELGADEILDTLIGLVDKSVVLREADTGGASRYQLLAVVRELGAEHADAAGACAVRQRAYYSALARAFAASFVGPGQLDLVARFGRDDANLRVAFDGALAAGDTAMAMELATACWPWLTCAGRLAEAGAWLARALEQDQHQTSDPERVRAPLPAAPFRTAVADPAVGGPVVGDPAAADPVVGDPAVGGPAAGDPAAGDPAVGDPAAEFRQLATRLAAWSLAAQGDIQGADALRETMTGTAAEPAAPAVRPILALVIGFDAAFAALRRGAFADCAARCDELTAGLPEGERWARGWAAWVKGLAGWFAGDRVAAGASLRAGLGLLAPFGGEQAVALYLEAFAWLAAGRGDYRRAARLQGAADARWQRLETREGVTVPRFGLPLLHAERDRAERHTRDALSAAGYAAEHATGAALSTEAALRIAVPGAASVPRPGPAGRAAAGAPAAALTGPAAIDVAPAGHWELLTAREREVAGLVARGMTNKDIASRLVVSKRTVDAHLEHILGKLGYSSRREVAALASQERDRGHPERERREQPARP
jgi:predicted ATPase/DNA-binding NarL/FixJ family response regulator